MSTVERERSDLRALEELWEAPAAEREPPPEPARRRRLPLVPGALVGGGWVAFFVVALALEPAPEPGMTLPAWTSAVFLVELTLLLAAAAVGPLLSRAGFAAAALAGPLGIALAVECRAAAHHLGNWWLLELGAAVALTGLAAAGLLQRLRR